MLLKNSFLYKSKQILKVNIYKLKNMMSKDLHLTALQLVFLRFEINVDDLTLVSVEHEPYKQYMPCIKHPNVNVLFFILNR